MRKLIGNSLLLGGVVLLATSFAYGKPLVDYGEAREWNRCKQEREVAMVNDDYPLSEECRSLLGSSNTGLALAGGGILLLAAARKMKKVKAG